MKHLTGHLLFLACMTAQAVLAQGSPGIAGGTAPNVAPVDPQKAEVVRQLLVVSGATNLMKQALDSMLPKMTAPMRQNPLFPPALVDEIQAKFAARFKAVDLAEFAIPVYSTNFTLEELQQLLAFHRSPLGQKVAQVQPTMFSQISAAAQQKGQEIGIEVTREILAQHPEYASQIQENSRKMKSQTTPQ